MSKEPKVKFDRTLKISKTLETQDKKIATEFLLMKDREGNIKLTKTTTSDSIIEANYNKQNFFTKDENVEMIYNLISSCFDNCQNLKVTQFIEKKETKKNVRK